MLNGDTISLVDQVKYLGVILDSKLNLHAHVEYVKARAQKRISVLKCIAGKSYGADRTVLLRMYKALIRPILEYASFILDGPGNRRVATLESVQNACLRIATGAIRTSPVSALQVEANIPPLYIRRKELLLRYYLKVKSDRQHPCHGVMNLRETWIYRDVSEQYLRRVSGFPVNYRLQSIINDLTFHPPEVQKPARSIAPWMMHAVRTRLLLTQDKRLMTMMDVQEAFQDLISEHEGHMILFTDGSKIDESVGCAFTINNAFFSFKLPDGISIYTAELVAIREALKYVRDHRMSRVLICTDSLSAIRALQNRTVGHPVLEEILEKNHSNICSGNECLFVWIPGHSGIAGNVRADYWAKKAIEKPNVTNVGVACNE